MAKHNLFCIFMILAVGVASVATEYSKVECTSDFDVRRRVILLHAKCQPLEVFVNLDPKDVHEEVSPGSVWVKRCVGVCDYDGDGDSCIPAGPIQIKNIPVRIFNAVTNTEVCVMYPLEEHVSCKCCAAGSEGCVSRRSYNPLTKNHYNNSIWGTLTV